MIAKHSLDDLTVS